MFSPHFESRGRDSSHAGWGCQFSINLLPRLICRLHSKSAWDHFSAMRSWRKSPDVTGNLKANGEGVDLICASSPVRASTRSTSASAPTYFLDNICVLQLFDESHPIAPPGFWFIPLLFFFVFFLFCCSKHTPKKSVSLIVKANKASGDSLAFGCSAPAPEYCPLLFFFLFFCSVAPNHLLRSLWWPLLKHSLRTNIVPPPFLLSPRWKRRN